MINKLCLTRLFNHLCSFINYVHYSPTGNAALSSFKLRHCIAWDFVLANSNELWVKVIHPSNLSDNFTLLVRLISSFSSIVHSRFSATTHTAKLNLNLNQQTLSKACCCRQPSMLILLTWSNLHSTKQSTIFQFNNEPLQLLATLNWTRQFVCVHGKLNLETQCSRSIWSLFDHICTRTRLSKCHCLVRTVFIIILLFKLSKYYEVYRGFKKGTGGELKYCTWI